MLCLRNLRDWDVSITTIPLWRQRRRRIFVIEKPWKAASVPVETASSSSELLGFSLFLQARRMLAKSVALWKAILVR